MRKIKNKMNLKYWNVIKWMDKFLRYTDYIAASSLYLKENGLLRNELKIEDFKPRILGHWGTVPGLNFIYAHLNYLIYKHKCEMMLVTGPGHGAPSVLANLLAEDSMSKFYPVYSRDEKGTNELIKDFSWPHSPFPSHVTPSVPGSLLEGGELGYSLSTAYGTVLDNPNLITAVIIGDGEAESGPLCASWNANKFLNPKKSGAVLPIVHINGFKISNPTIFASMSNEELSFYFKGLGYLPLIVEGKNLHVKMIKSLETAYQTIRKIQKSKKEIIKPKWPVILLKTEKGWKGPKRFEGHAIQNSFRSHGIPFGRPHKDKHEFEVIKKWLESYKIHELVDEKGRPKKEVLKFLPPENLRMGVNKHAVGGNFYKALKLPDLKKFSVPVKNRGELKSSSMITSGDVFGEIFKRNPNNFRMFCPDEMESNLLHNVFKTTKRGYVWPIIKNAEDISYDGRVFEMLSEHTLEGLMQGYVLTGRHGIFVTYEAFATIISSMVDQHAKFIKQSFSIPWRKKIPSLTFILSSVSWRQDHNGFSHQNPSFVSNVLQKHAEFCQIYYPPDTNSMLATIEEVSKKNDSISIIVAGKRDIFQWLTLDEARKQAKSGVAIWDWVGGKDATKNPDVILASAGDYITHEAVMAVKWCKENIPEMKIRYINVSELTGNGLGDKQKNQTTQRKYFEQLFTKDKHIVFAYHGYINDIEQVLWPLTENSRLSIFGYHEAGSTTTPFDLKVANKISCYNLAIEMIKQCKNKKIEGKKKALINKLYKIIENHQKYILLNGDDPKEVYDMHW